MHDVLCYFIQEGNILHGNPKPYMVLKYCAQSLAHKPLSNLVQIHPFLGQGKNGHSRTEAPRTYLNSVAEGALNQRVIHGWHLLAIFIFLIKIEIVES